MYWSEHGGTVQALQDLSPGLTRPESRLGPFVKTMLTDIRQRALHTPAASIPLQQCRVITAVSTLPCAGPRRYAAKA
jgi:hypothetical protein